MRTLTAVLISVALGLGLAFATDTIELGISGYNTPVSVSVSVSAYTNVTSAATRANITGILIDNPSSNTGVMHGHIGNCTSTAIATTVLGPIEIAPGSNGGYIALSSDACLWLLSRAASAENVTVQGISQRR